MHASAAFALALPILLPLAVSGAPSASPRDIYDLAARQYSPREGQIRHESAKRAMEDFGLRHGDAQRKIRRKKRSCVPKSTGGLAGNTTSSSTASMTSSTTALGNYNAAQPTNQTSTSVVSTTSTTSSVAASTSTAASSGGSSGSMMDFLFPQTGQNWWTTYTGSSSALSFTGALKPLTAGRLPSEVTAPDGSDSLVAYYPANTFSLSSANNVGFSFYTQGQHNNVNVAGGKEVLFSYSVYFPSGFNFVKGGKMPGLYGGTTLAEAKSCSGGRQNDRDQCFSARLMWRTNGMGEFYNYYPTSIQQGNGYCQTAPYSICDTTYGDSIGRGSFSWATGAWTTVAQRVKLNDVGQANGEQQLWVNGQPIMHLTGLQIITQTSYIYGIMAQTFFGGNDQSWASPSDQAAYFKDWSLTVLS